MAASQTVRRMIGRDLGGVVASSSSVFRTSPAILVAAHPGRRSFSTSLVSRLGNPPPMATSPFKEPAGRNPADAYVEVSKSLHDYGAYLTSCIPKYIQQFSVYKDELTLYTAPSGIVGTLTFLRDHKQCQYKQLIDISGVDYPTRPKRFEVVYHLLSIHYASRLRVKTYADEVSPVPSVSGIFRSADWFEREVYDMFGVFFHNHPDLRRILTDYGFEGYPLRKDFPLTGYTEVRYDEEKKRVVYEPLQLSQAFRNFEGANSPWEQTGHGKDPRPDHFKLPTPEPSADKPKSS
ncbi:hypothetical protein PGT21_010852 [Puccinia graminis f. sp. tritici]|uniref:NADH:ubiquinone oxidoreductase 30kDa subunit domain-containing protein n=1 Tax=Puccinia graminis f. sp. tritici TaxID=56615 RepID=A0A5B0LT88_PUCGR|nr:hypothetical protein PGT21_010852 [Puccinia graminis f. sp. tritici]KAA1092162.1 hypothetical protein PGTUg99_010855 [Puccinia graminis f. sp. tritici]